MKGCEAHKAFTSLWSVTEKIFEHVADIRNLLNTTNIPVTGSSSDDPPPYESSTSEYLIDQLKERINCLEDLNKQRRLLYDRYTINRDACVPVENVDSEDKQQVQDKSFRYTIPEVSTPRDVAIKTLRSFLRTRQAAVTANRLHWAQMKQGLSALSQFSFDYSSESGYTWKPPEEKKFHIALRLARLFRSQLIEDQSSLLRDGKILEEKILSVSHDRGEETNELLRRVQDSYRKTEELAVPTLFDLLLPTFDNLLLQSRDSDKPRRVVESIVATMRTFKGRYVKAAESYQNTLQDLADLIFP